MLPSAIAHTLREDGPHCMGADPTRLSGSHHYTVEEPRKGEVVLSKEKYTHSHKHPREQIRRRMEDNIGREGIHRTEAEGGRTNTRRRRTEKKRKRHSEGATHRKHTAAHTRQQQRTETSEESTRRAAGAIRSLCNSPPLLACVSKPDLPIGKHTERKKDTNHVSGRSYAVRIRKLLVMIIIITKAHTYTQNEMAS